MEHHSVICSDFEDRYVLPARGRTLIVGSRLYAEKPDRRALYADAIGVDMQEGPGVDCVLNLEEKIPAGFGKFEHIECLSVLEHSRRPWLLAANLEKLLRSGGTLHVQVPFVWRYHGYPSDLWRFTAEGVRELFPGIEWRALMYLNGKLTPKPLVPSMLDDEDRVYLQRTEVCGFGVRTNG